MLDLTTRNDGKRREATCGYTEGVDGINTSSNTRALLLLPPSRTISSDFYDDLALCAPLLDVGQSFRGRLEWKDPIYNRTNCTGIDERAELA